MRHELQTEYKRLPGTDGIVNTTVCPQSPRSILVGGNIEVCIQKEACEKWDDMNACDNKATKIIECKPLPTRDQS
jgi:hypothetical protein